MTQHLCKRVAACAALTLAAGLFVAGRRGADARQTPTQAQTTAQSQTDFDQAKALEELRRRIAGQEDKPAEQVFRNIQVLKGVPAARLLRMMEMGFTRALGVNCTHCHVPGEWEKDDKPTKPIAREMFTMTRTINSDLLRKIKNLRSENPTINCMTCHRGQTQPAAGGPGGGRRPEGQPTATPATAPTAAPTPRPF